MRSTKPDKEHEWLQKLVGEWTYDNVDSVTPPAAADGSDKDLQPPPSKGSETGRSLGGYWVICEGEGVMEGTGSTSPPKTIMTLGYNPATKRFTGTWIGSMMTHLWTYDGELDTAKNILTLSSEGPAMSGEAGAMDMYRDVIEFKSDDHRVTTAYLLKSNGTTETWEPFMTTNYYRKKD
jgi:Protein of unknown function (DUF1579)